MHVVNITSCKIFLSASSSTALNLIVKFSKLIPSNHNTDYCTSECSTSTGSGADVRIMLGSAYVVFSSIHLTFILYSISPVYELPSHPFCNISLTETSTSSGTGMELQASRVVKSMPVILLRPSQKRRIYRIILKAYSRTNVANRTQMLLLKTQRGSTLTSMPTGSSVSSQFVSITFPRKLDVQEPLSRILLC